MNYDEMTDEEFYSLTPEQNEEYLKESYKTTRKIEILEKLDFSQWTKNELLDLIVNFDLIKTAKRIQVTSIKEFVKNGIFRQGNIEFEEYKIDNATKEMQEELKESGNVEIRPLDTLIKLPFLEWTRNELLDLIDEYDLNVRAAIAVRGKDYEKGVCPIFRYAGLKYRKWMLED